MYLRATHERSTEDVVLWNQKASDAGKKVFNSSYYTIFCIVAYRMTFDEILFAKKSKIQCSCIKLV